jgi:hypothetical protein
MKARKACLLAHIGGCCSTLLAIFTPYNMYTVQMGYLSSRFDLLWLSMARQEGRIRIGELCGE